MSLSSSSMPSPAPKKLETIVAPITAQGKGAVAIIRISGPEALTIAHQCFHCKPQHRLATRCHFIGENGRVLDEGLALFFRAPHSFTGEDVLEFQGHGSPILVKIILDYLLTLPNVRLAQPGEFSERAFLNGKIDLTQAEAIADLIAAESEDEAVAALKSLKGHFSGLIDKFETQLIEIRAQIEAALDFLEDELTPEDQARLLKKIKQLKDGLEELKEETKKNLQQRSKLRIGLFGAPNVGKSSLFNLLVKKNRAIVTDIAGTTRDFLEEIITLGNESFSIIDTAGLRKSQDRVEQMGIQRTQQLMLDVDLILWVEDASCFTKKPSAFLKETLKTLKNSKLPILGIWNKIDLLKQENPLHEMGWHKNITTQWLPLSCKNYSGFKDLQDFLLSNQHGKNHSAEFFARKRHLMALERACSLFEAQSLSSSHLALIQWDQVADMLLNIQNALGTITGKRYTDDLLDTIFSTFCLGK